MLVLNPRDSPRYFYFGGLPLVKDRRPAHRRVPLLPVQAVTIPEEPPRLPGMISPEQVQ